MTSRLIDRYRLLALLAVALAARAAAFGNANVHVDEQFYLHVARRLVHGALPFVDIWDRKPIGLFLVYWPAALLPFPLGVWTYQIMACVAAIATGWLVARIAEHAGWHGGATLAGAAYILLLDWAGGQGGQAPVFYNLPMALATLLTLRGGARRELLAMLSIGIAMQIKYTALFEGVFFGLYIVFRHWRSGERKRLPIRATSLVLIALLPTAAAFGFYFVHGHGDAFFYANFRSIFDRGRDPLGEAAGNLVILALWLAVPIAAGVAGLRAGAQGSGTAAARRFVALWLAAAVAAVLVLGGWYLHYALPVMLPAAVAAASWFTVRPRTGPAFIAVAAIAGQFVVWSNRTGRGTPEQFAALVERLQAAPSGCMYLYSGPPALYDATGRSALSRYVFPGHLYRSHETGAIGADQRTEVRRILMQRPAIVVMRPFSRGERRDIRALVEQDMRQHYRALPPSPLGHESLSLWVRR